MSFQRVLADLRQLLRSSSKMVSRLLSMDLLFCSSSDTSAAICASSMAQENRPGTFKSFKSLAKISSFCSPLAKALSPKGKRIAAEEHILGLLRTVLLLIHLLKPPKSHDLS